MVCFFPTGADYAFVDKSHGCDQKEFFQRNWKETVPQTYDPRCRPWFQKQFENKETAIFTDIYKFSNGPLGITTCLPLTDAAGKYQGAYCQDFIPTGQDSALLQRYKWKNEKVNDLAAKVDYVLFNQDEAFKRRDFDNSYLVENDKTMKLYSAMTKLLFQEKKTASTMKVYSMQATDKTHDTISVFMDRFNLSYGLTGDEFRLPKAKIELGVISATDTDDRREDFIFIV